MIISMDNHPTTLPKPVYSRPTYPKYPEILKQSNIRYALTSLERQRQILASDG
jgi:hypothetical protein